MTTEPAVFSAIFAASYAAHEFGDHWIQTHHQALSKGAPTTAGRLACLRHVISLTVTKGVALALVTVACGLRFPLGGALLLTALLVDAATHYWADRRSTLLALADRFPAGGKGDFARLGDGLAAPCGTGAYALDQSFHVLWLFLTALVAAMGASS